MVVEQPPAQSYFLAFQALFFQAGIRSEKHMWMVNLNHRQNLEIPDPYSRIAYPYPHVFVYCRKAIFWERRMKEYHNGRIRVCKNDFSVARAPNGYHLWTRQSSLSRTTCNGAAASATTLLNSLIAFLTTVWRVHRLSLNKETCLPAIPYHFRIRLTTCFEHGRTWIPILLAKGQIGQWSVRTKICATLTTRTIHYQLYTQFEDLVLETFSTSVYNCKSALHAQQNSSKPMKTGVSNIRGLTANLPPSNPSNMLIYMYILQ